MLLSSVVDDVIDAVGGGQQPGKALVAQRPTPLRRSFSAGDRHYAILDHATKMRTERQSTWDGLFDELCDFFNPNRKGFLSEQRSGADRYQDIYGSPPEMNARALAAYISTNLRQPGNKWFKAKPKNAMLASSEMSRLWCDVVTEITYAELYHPEAEFEKQCAIADLDVVTLGTAVIKPGFFNKGGKRHLTFQVYHLKQVVLLADAYGRINGGYFFYEYTLRSLVDEWGEDALPPQIRSKLDSGRPNMDEKIEVMNACIPNGEYQYFGSSRQKWEFPYVSLWMVANTREVLEEKGYYEFPYVCPRWDTSTGETYGRSPAMVALRDARLLDAMTRSFIDSAELSLMPPLMGPVNAFRGGIDLRARGLSLYDLTGMPAGTKPLEPIMLGSQPDKTYEFMLRLEERIGQAFYRDILELPRMGDGTMTATEINARLDQFLRQAAPVFARLEATYNAGLINRVFSILSREGYYPPAPEDLQGEEIEFAYESPVKVARDRAEGGKIMEGLGMIAQVAQAAGPVKGMDVIDNIDFDVTTRMIGMKAGLPQALFKNLNQMLEERAARMKQMQMQQMAEMAGKVGPAMGGIAKMGDALTNAKQGGMIDTNNPFPIPAESASQAAQSVFDGVF